MPPVSLPLLTVILAVLPIVNINESVKPYWNNAGPAFHYHDSRRQALSIR